MLTFHLYYANGFYHDNATNQEMLCDSHLEEYFPGLGNFIIVTVSNKAFKGSMRGKFFRHETGGPVYLMIKSKTEYVVQRARERLPATWTTIYFKVENDGASND